MIIGAEEYKEIANFKNLISGWEGQRWQNEQ